MFIATIVADFLVLSWNFLTWTWSAPSFFMDGLLRFFVFLLLCVALFLVGCIFVAAASFNRKGCAIVVMVIVFGAQFYGSVQKDQLKNIIVQYNNVISQQSEITNASDLFHDDAYFKKPPEAASEDPPQPNGKTYPDKDCISTTDLQSIQKQYNLKMSRVAGLEKENSYLLAEKAELSKEVLNLQNEVNSLNNNLKHKVWKEMSDRTLRDFYQFWFSIFEFLTSYRAIYIWLFVYSLVFSLIYTNRSFVSHHH